MTKSPFLLGEIDGGLYHAAHSISSASSSVLLSNKSPAALESLKLWHLRLGHIPFYQIKHLVADCSLTDVHEQMLCTVCPAARQTRLSFPLSSIKTVLPFQLLHVDLWGPYRIPTHNGLTQFVTIVDDFTRSTWTHFIKFKSDVVLVVQKFVQYVETKFNAKVLCVRSDNAKELTEGPMKQYYDSKGIFHETSCSNTPQQNGVVERKHRHLLETARALFFQAKLPPKFWGESILCATFLLNRTPLKPLHFRTPYEVLHKHKPDLSLLKPFGCLCYVSTSKVGRHKFDPRALPCVFLGYPAGQKGFKVLNLSTYSISVSRDVHFHELHFPFHLSQTPHDSPVSSIYLPTFTASSSSYDFDTPDIFSSFSSSSTNLDSDVSLDSSVSVPGITADATSSSHSPLSTPVLPLHDSS